MQTVLKELRLTLALALPMIVGQVSQMLIGITDAAMIGRVGTVELAAASFAHGIFGTFYVVGLGLLLPVGVFTARDHGAGDDAGCAAWLQHGRIFALVVGAASFLLLAGVSTQLHRFGQPAEVVAVMGPFFVLNSLSLVPVFYFQVQRQYLDALGRPWVGTSIGSANEGFKGFADSGLTLGGGAGVDVHAGHRAAVRVQYDLIGSFADIVETNARLGVGLVVRFGRR